MSETEEAFLRDHCIDLPAALARIQSLPPEVRLSALLSEAGCEFHDASRRLLATPSVRLASVGGLPVHALARHGLGLDAVASLTRESMGAAASMSYLTLPGGSASSAYDSIVSGRGEASAAHVVGVSLLVAGVTCAVENEFNGQRDLVHLARVTEARTRAQSAPPVVVPDPTLVPFHALLIEAADALRARAASAMGERAGSRAGLEALNLMHPAAKATAFVLSGTLRNLGKLLSAEDDLGKEDEYRSALRMIRRTLSPSWPSLFGRKLPHTGDGPFPPSGR